MNMEFKNLISAERKKSHLSQTDLARIAGLSIDDLVSIESQQSKATVKQLSKIAAALNLPEQHFHPEHPDPDIAQIVNSFESMEDKDLKKKVRRLLEHIALSEGKEDKLYPEGEVIKLKALH